VFTYAIPLALQLGIGDLVRVRLQGRPHGGLVVVKKGRRWIRHASASPSVMRVVEEPLAGFVEHQRRASSRPLVGLAVFAVPDNRARLAILPPLAP